MSVRIPAFRRHRARQISTAARTVAQRTPETLILVRHRAQPTAVTVARLAGTAVFAYLVALPLPVTPRPVLAPLTACSWPRSACTRRCAARCNGWRPW